MENILEQVKNFVNNEINIGRSDISGDFVQGYIIAMIDVKDFINFKENEKNKLIGKYGFFWDDIKNPVYYGKLDAIVYNNKYGDKVSYETNGMIPFTYFSLTHPEHLK
jgi:hypothetical protein